MNEHAPNDDVDTAYRGWYRGGCRFCMWLGPWRRRKADAQRDARQHTLDVRMYPDPYPQHRA